jgi:hypothetical protein
MLLTPEDLQPTLNIDLTDPNGLAIATSLIEAVQALLSSPAVLGFSIETSVVTTYVTPDSNRVWLPTGAPVSDLAVATLSSDDTTYVTLPTDQIQHHGTNEINILASVPRVFHGLRLTYTTGWTAETLPADIRQAMIDIIGLKLLEVSNFSTQPTTSGDAEGEGGGESSTAPGALKRVVSGGYTEEYSVAESDAYWKAKAAQMSRTIGDNIPPAILNSIKAYRPPFAI